jgi:adenylate cyclase
MAEERVQRRLAAILAADVVGYSRLMGADEAGTRARFNAHLRDLIQPTIAGHDGRIVKTTGDGLLVEVASVVDAVQCAVTIQKGMADRNAAETEDRRLDFRVGVNLGDVIIEGDDIHGDGVNIAARLEGLAEPGGLCVSGKVVEEVRNKLEFSFEDMGAQKVKNIAEPVHAFRSRLDQELTTVSQETPAKPLTPPDKPSVAVLPFENMSGDPEQEYFADGMTEDIITALAAWRSFPVIARNSTFAYKGKSSDVRKVASDLGARYVLEGSVRRADKRVRITVQLVDATTGHHILAERFDRDLGDIFDLQDEIAQRIAASVQPQLEQAEQKRSAAKKPKNLDAWDYYQRGMALLYQFTKEGNVQARKMFARSIELEPTYSQPYVGLAYSHQLDILMDITDAREDSLDKLFKTARQAVALDDSDSMAHVMLCFGCRWARKHDIAIAEAEKAVELNPSNAFAHFHLGNVLDLAGNPEEGIANMEKGLKLNPRDPRMHFFMSGMARVHLNARRYQDAVEWARRSIHNRPDHPRAHAILAISLAHLDRQKEARAALDECEGVRPGFAKRWALLRQYRKPADNEHILEGLRRAGLPE